MSGGMIEFGPDGKLYIALGDGGDHHDPGDRAQNLDDLLGKILRITVTDPGTSPGVHVSRRQPVRRGRPGRDLGVRLPQSLAHLLRPRHGPALGRRRRPGHDRGDRHRHARRQLRLAHVGGLGLHRPRRACSSSDFIFPVTEYPQAGGGRCSVTGGYVYRASAAALPTGTYVFADFCTGEILGLAGGTTRLLLDTTLSIASFGEDEQGEILVMALGGAVYRLAGGGTFPVLPASRSFPAGGGADTFAVSTAAGCAWTAVSNAQWIQVTGGTPGSGRGTVSYTVAANPGTSQRTGTVTVRGQTHTVIQAGTPGSCTFQVSPTRIRSAERSACNSCRCAG